MPAQDFLLHHWDVYDFAYRQQMIVRSVEKTTFTYSLMPQSFFLLFCCKCNMLIRITVISEQYRLWEEVTRIP